mmetsp:Transcript_13203/g.22696  ORF Transcript_13203/g.22696 Transcript_13203/m.22696 type:complete len:163 (+) Transcript_13203:1387-1875(+)
MQDDDNASSASTQSASTAPRPTHSVEEVKTWYCVWASYFDLEKSHAQGRRVGKDKAVQQPSAEEIAIALNDLKLIFVAEQKQYTRDFLDSVRFRVQLRNKDKSLVNKDIRNKKALLNAIGTRLVAKPDRKVPSKPSLLPVKPKAPPSAKKQKQKLKAKMRKR